MGVGLRGLHQRIDRHPLVGLVGLGDVAGAQHDGGVSGLVEERGFGPEVDVVSFGQTGVRKEGGHFIAGVERGGQEAFGPLNRGIRGQARPERGGHGRSVVAGTRAEAETREHLRIHHVGRDAAFQNANVESGVFQDAAGFGEGERGVAPADGVVRGRVSGGVGHAGVGGFAFEDGRERSKAAVTPHRFGFGGLGHDHRTGVPIGVGQEVFDAVAVSGFLVGVEEHRHVVVGCFDRGQHARGRAL